MNFIQRIKEGTADESVHKKFVRYSLGTFVREPMKFAVGGKKVTVKAGYEYADVLLKFMAELLNENAEITGVIVSKSGDLKGKLSDFGIEPAVRGKKYTFKAELSAEDLRKFIEEFSEEYLLVGFKSGNYKLKTGKSIPKPGKVSEDFLTASFPKDDLSKLKNEYLFDVDSDFTKAEVQHTYVIEDIVVPKEYENDSALARKHAKRKGKVIRKLTVDEKESQTEFPLEA